MEVEQSEKATNLRIIRRIVRFARPHWFPMMLAFFLSQGHTGMALLAPWPLKFVFDAILVEKALQGTTLYLLIGITVGMVAKTRRWRPMVRSRQPFPGPFTGSATARPPG